MAEHIRAVQRALRLILTMNRRDLWALSDLSVAAKLAKATTHRLLQTLEAEGLVHSFSGHSGLYRLTTKAEALSRGVTPTIRLAEAADHVVNSTTLAIQWPVAFGILEENAMRVISCGRDLIPERSARPNTVGQRFSLAASALGMAYLSPLPDATAASLALSSGSKEKHSPNPLPSLPELLDGLEEVRTRGYAVRKAARGDQDAALAIPVMHQGRPVGSLVCTTFPRSLSDGMIAEALPRLTAAADCLSRAYEAR